MILCFIRSGMKGAHIKHNEKNCHILKLTGRGGEKKKKRNANRQSCISGFTVLHTHRHTHTAIVVRPPTSEFWRSLTRFCSGVLDSSPFTCHVARLCQSYSLYIQHHGRDNSLQKAKVQRESVLLVQEVSDGEQATRNIHRSDKLQRHQGQFWWLHLSAVCSCQKLLVCIVCSGNKDPCLRVIFHSYSLSAGLSAACVYLKHQWNINDYCLVLGWFLVNCLTTRDVCWELIPALLRRSGIGYDVKMDPY